MPIPFSCPHCGAQTVVSDEFAGHSGPCFQCGRTITVPGRPPVAGGGHRTAASAGRSPLPGWAIGLAALVVVVVGGGALLTAFLAPAASASREAADRATCADRLQRIGVALSEYDQARFRLPNVAEEVRGEPVSWRVLILPSMEYGGVYQKYRMDEPWDGPSNRALAAIEMTDYHCPSDAQSPGNQANYLAVVGERTILQQQKRTSLRRVEDGTSNTIMVTEAHRTGVVWSEPRDLDVDRANFTINDPAGGGFSSPHADGMNVLFGDGSVRFLSSSIDPEVLEALTTADGDEPTGGSF